MFGPGGSFPIPLTPRGSCPEVTAPSWSRRKSPRAKSGSFPRLSMELNHRRGSFPEHEAMEPGQRAGYPRGDLAAGSVHRKEPHPNFARMNGVFSHEAGGELPRVPGPGQNPRCFPRKEPHPITTGKIAKFQGRGLMIKGLE